MQDDFMKRTFAYIRSLGKPANPKTVENLLTHVIKPQFATQSGKQMLLLEFLEDSLQVVSETARTLVSPGKVFAFRGRQSQPYSFSQELDADKTIHFSVIPNMDRSEVFLSLRVTPDVPLRAKLQVGGRALESVQSINQETWFDSAIKRSESPEIVIFQENQEIGRIQLLISGF